MRCVLHIGTEKTATTSIQEFVYHNRGGLERLGIGLSDRLEVFNNRKIVGFFQNSIDDYLVDKGILTLDGKCEFFRDFPAEFRDEMRSLEQKCDLVFISSEHFHSRLTSVEEIQALKEFLSEIFEEVKVICYFREQSEVAASSYSTYIKFGGCDSFSDFLAKNVRSDSHYYNYHLSFSKWAEVFDSNCLIPKIFSSSTFTGSDIRKDILLSIKGGIDVNALDYTVGPTNESLSSVQIELARVINRHFPRYNELGQYSITKEGMMNSLICSGLSSTGKLRNANSDEIYLDFEESNIAFGREFFGTAKNPFSRPRVVEQHSSPPGPFISEDGVKLLCDYFDEFLYRFVTGKAIEDFHADRLRDIALGFEQGRKIDRSEAAYLMRLAHGIRPGGELIKNKLAQLEADAPTKSSEP